MANMNVTLIDHMGSDLSVANAARVSFDKESKFLSERDQKLIQYLAKHNHWSPFAHTSVSLRIKAPIFVARQLGKHQVGLVWNEVSRRYVNSAPEFYEPESWRKKADNVKQGSSTEDVSKLKVDGWYLPGDDYSFTKPLSAVAQSAIEYAHDAYYVLIESGVCPEQARMVLPQSMMTEWIWTGSLYAFARVYKERTHPHAQLETKQIALQIGDIMAELFPYSWKALTNG